MKAENATSKVVEEELGISNSPVDKKQLRLIKNRLAADASRKRKKEHLEATERRNTELEMANTQLLARIELLEKINHQINSENILLKKELDNIKTNEYLSYHSPQSNSYSASSGSFSPILGTLDQKVFISPLDQNEIQTDLLFDDYFNLESGTDKASLGIFSIFLFSFASFLLPSAYTALMPTGSTPLATEKSVGLPLLLPEPFTSNTWPISLSTPKAIPTQKKEFLDSLNLWSRLDPPNAALAIESLFTEAGSLDATYAVINPYKNEKSESKSNILLGPSIKLVPFTIISDNLKLSLLANVPSCPQQEGGMLKLDMQVFSATWFDAVEL